MKRRGVVACVAAACAAGVSAVSPAAGGDEGKFSPEARAVYERARERVLAAKSAQGTFTLTWRVDTGADDAEENSETVDFSVQGPDRLFMETRGFRVYFDGASLTVHCPGVGQYMVEKLSGAEKLRDHLDEITGGQARTVPFEVLIRPEMTSEQMLGAGRELTGAAAGEHEGRRGTWLRGVGSDDDGEAYKVEVFYPEETGVAAFMRLDMTRSQQQRVKDWNESMADQEDFEPQPAVVWAGWEIDYSKARLGEAIPPDRFVFTPGSGDKLVSEWTAEESEPLPQEALLGLAAPAFAGENFDGQAVALADFGGRVVVLDFWATWCGPCVAALPHMQKLKEEFAGQDVVFIGMNRDQPGSGAKVKKFLERKKVDIAQFDDTAGKASREYRVTGIPCVAVIDQKGVLQSVRTGFGPGEGEHIGAEIRTLLSGKPLKTEEEFAAAREGAGDDQSGGGYRRGARIALPETDAARVVKAGRIAANANGFRGGAFSPAAVDLAGDGRARVVLQSSGGGALQIISRDGLSVEKLKLEGVRQGVEVRELRAAVIDGQRRLVAAIASYGGSPKGRIAVYDLDGKLVWKFDPALGSEYLSGASLDTADLDGDGRDEVVALISVFSSGGRSEFRSGASLLVLSPEGRLIAQKEMPEHAQTVWVAAEPSEGKGRLILVAGIGGVSRFRFDPSPSAGAVNAAEEESK